MWAGHTESRVGSVTIAADARSPPSISARVPIDSYSSSHTAVTMISLASEPRAAARAAATHIAAIPLFISLEPRPNKLPPVFVGTNGSWRIPSVPTTSRCPFNTSGDRPVGPMRATTFGRPGATSCTETAKPHARSTSPRKRAHAVSPGAPGTRLGLRESIATSASVSATGSSGSSVCTGVGAESELTAMSATAAVHSRLWRFRGRADFTPVRVHAYGHLHPREPLIRLPSAAFHTHTFACERPWQ